MVLSQYNEGLRRSKIDDLRQTFDYVECIAHLQQLHLGILLKLYRVGRKFVPCRGTAFDFKPAE